MLRQALAVPSIQARSLAQAIQNRFRPVGGVDLDLPARAPRHPDRALRGG